MLIEQEIIEVVPTARASPIHDLGLSITKHSMKVLTRRIYITFPASMLSEYGPPTRIVPCRYHHSVQADDSARIMACFERTRQTAATKPSTPTPTNAGMYVSKTSNASPPR